MQDRKMYPSLDIVKFIMALLILMQHTAYISVLRGGGAVLFNNG